MTEMLHFVVIDFEDVGKILKKLERSIAVEKIRQGV